MSLTLGMILFGGLLIYGGWTNRSVWALARGDDTVQKPRELAAEQRGGIQGPAVTAGG